MRGARSRAPRSTSRFPREANPTPREAQRPRVLVVDDNPDILETTAALVDYCGYEPLRVETAAQILPTMRRMRPAILMQDVYMPDLDLAELMRRIRSDRDLAHTPVILFTASVEADDVVQRVGADGMLRKPFDLDTLQSAIHGVLAHAHPT